MPSWRVVQLSTGAVCFFIHPITPDHDVTAAIRNDKEQSLNLTCSPGWPLLPQIAHALTIAAWSNRNSNVTVLLVLNNT
jgi:xanthine/CO dehydrogenase XdhC/CoxF family maturation factor